MGDVTSYVGFPIALTAFLALLRLSGLGIPMWAVLLPLTVLAAILTLVWLLALVLEVRGKLRTEDSVDRL